MQIKKFFQIIVVLILVVISCITITGYYLFFPYGKEHPPVEVIITRKSPISTIARSLQQQNIIRSSRALLFWLKITGKDRKIQAGKVLFVQGEGVFSVGDKLLHAVALEKTLKITEGLTIEQTAGRIQHQLNLDSAEIVKLCNDSVFVSKMGIDAQSLEGYLFPETYRLPENATAEDVITRMIQHFKQAYERVSIDSVIVASYSIHQIVTIASIVEKEATLAEERGRIAGVFHNRLKKGYPLGADPTIRYIFRKFSGPLRVSELNVSSPYNTRKFKGLPPGPICSPGFDAIQAAASPLDTDELYFVAKWDGSGAQDFSRTNAEHDRKKLLIRKENEQRIQRKDSR
jgi:UPF0755 protein